MKRFPRRQFSRSSLLKRTAVVVVANLIYALLFALIYPSVGDASGALSALPTSISGWLLGAHLGFVAGLANFALNEFLYGTLSPTVQIMSVQSIPGLLFSVLISTLVGGLSDLIYHIRKLSADLQLEVAQRKQTQEALVQARDRALDLSSAKDKLLHTVSHDLRTPLAAVLGYAELLEEDLADERTADTQGTIEMLIHSTHYILNMVNQLLEQARVEKRGTSIQIEPLVVDDLVQAVVEKTKILAEAKGLEFEVQIDPALPAAIEGDFLRLQQILINLVGNAIKFTPKGYVRLHLKKESEQQWQMAVADSGIGIPEELQKAIFEPFRQGAGASETEIAGSGLGLSIVHELTYAMGGEVSLSSTAREGSQFIVTLPLVPARALAAA